MKLYEVLARARRAKGLSLRELEIATGISNGLISQMETGHIEEPAFRKIVKISKALDLSLDKLAAAE